MILEAVPYCLSKRQNAHQAIDRTSRHDAGALPQHQGKLNLTESPARLSRPVGTLGISGLYLARLRKSSPPVVLRGEDPQDLIDAITGWQGRQYRAG
jgi:hypothetical protein